MSEYHIKRGSYDQIGKGIWWRALCRSTPCDDCAMQHHYPECECGCHDRKGERWIWMRCPNGHIATLCDHTIRPNGKVEPSVVCPVDGCGFHAMVVLDGWEAQA